MKRVNELIVVEGKHDSARLRCFFYADIVETGGSGLSDELLEKLRKEKRQIIIFTDPDSNGNRLRELISREIPTCLHAFLPADSCRKKNKVGIEHASEESLNRALANLVSYSENSGKLTSVDLLELGLSAGNTAKNRRQKISLKYHIGDCNGKTILKRLNALNIDKATLKKDLDDGQL